MEWMNVTRLEAKYDFEDWRVVEDSRTQKQNHVPGMAVVRQTRRLGPDLFQNPASHFELFWGMNDQLEEWWLSSSDEDAQMADDILRQFAQFGNPEACLKLCSFSAKDDKEQALRWLARASYLFSSPANLGVTPGQMDVADYQAFLQSRVDRLSNSLVNELGWSEIEVASAAQGNLADVGPNSSIRYCPHCGMQLLQELDSFSCPGFYYNHFFDSTEPEVEESVEFIRTHGDQGGGLADRWPFGVSGIFRWDVLTGIMLPDN